MSPTITPIKICSMRGLICFWLAFPLLACQTDHTPQTSTVMANSPQALRLKLTQYVEDLDSPTDQSKQNQTKSPLSIQDFLLNAKEVQSLLRNDPLNHQLGVYYVKQLREPASRELPWALKEAKRQGLSHLEITRVGPQNGSSNAHGDLALLEQLKQRDGLYTIRLHKEGSTKGLRISGWLYLEDRGWVCLLKLGEEIKKRWSI